MPFALYQKYTHFCKERLLAQNSAHRYNWVIQIRRPIAWGPVSTWWEILAPNTERETKKRTRHPIRTSDTTQEDKSGPLRPPSRHRVAGQHSRRGPYVIIDYGRSILHLHPVDLIIPDEILS